MRDVFILHSVFNTADIEYNRVLIELVLHTTGVVYIAQNKLFPKENGHTCPDPYSSLGMATLSEPYFVIGMAAMPELHQKQHCVSNV